MAEFWVGGDIFSMVNITAIVFLYICSDNDDYD